MIQSSANIRYYDIKAFISKYLGLKKHYETYWKLRKIRESKTIKVDISTNLFTFFGIKKSNDKPRDLTALYIAFKKRYPDLTAQMLQVYYYFFTDEDDKIYYNFIENFSKNNKIYKLMSQLFKLRAWGFTRKIKYETDTGIKREFDQLMSFMKSFSKGNMTRLNLYRSMLMLSENIHYIEKCYMMFQGKAIPKKIRKKIWNPSERILSKPSKVFNTVPTHIEDTGYDLNIKKKCRIPTNFKSYCSYIGVILIATNPIKGKILNIKKFPTESKERIWNKTNKNGAMFASVDDITLGIALFRCTKGYTWAFERPRGWLWDLVRKSGKENDFMCDRSIPVMTPRDIFRLHVILSFEICPLRRIKLTEKFFEMNFKSKKNLVLYNWAKNKKFIKDDGYTKC